MITISFINPYPTGAGDRRKTQVLPDLETARQMVAWYNSLGYKARIGS
jgi:hypothetical protein